MKFDKKYLFALLPLFFIILLFWLFTDIVIYIILAWVLSMVGAPLMRLFRKILPRNTSALLTLLSFLFLFFILFSIFIPPIFQQARNLAQVDYEQLLSGLEEPLDDWNQWLINKRIIKSPDSVSAILDEKPEIKNEIINTRIIDLESELQKLGDSLTRRPIQVIVEVYPNGKNGLETDAKGESEIGTEAFFDKFRETIIRYLDPSVIQNVFGSIVGFFGNLLIATLSIFFIAFFFLREQGLFIQMLAAIVPNNYEEQVVRAVEDTSSLLIRYFVGVAFQVTIITIFVSIVLKILGVKNALLIGFFAAMMNVIPYIGPIIGASFAVIITVSSNLELPFYSVLLPMLLKVMLVFAVMQLMDNLILQPNIFSKSVKAHPLEIFIIIMGAAKIAGILGMVLAIPTYTVLRVVAKVFLSEFKLVQRITKGM